jgi:small ligand-binding sensory domain FIST
MPEKIYGQFRTVMLAGNTEYAGGRFAIAHAHFSIAHVLGKRLMMYAGSDLFGLEEAVEAVAESGVNLSRSCLRRGVVEEALSTHLATCDYLVRWLQTSGGDPATEEIVRPVLDRLLESGEELHRIADGPEEAIAGLRARAAAACRAS